MTDISLFSLFYSTFFQHVFLFPFAFLPIYMAKDIQYEYILWSCTQELFIEDVCMYAHMGNMQIFK